MTSGIQTPQETPKTSKTRLGLAALAMSTIISGTQAQTNDLLAQCDYNHNGIIDGRTYLKDLKKKLKSDGDYSTEDKHTYKIALTNAKKERKCKTDVIKQENAQQEIYLAQLDTSIEGLKKELKRVEEEIKQLDKQSQQLDKQSQQLDKQNRELREQLERQRQWLIQKIKEMAGRV